MIEKTVKCETITPLISRSLDFTMANNNDYKIYNFELRPQSVKGVLHFWFRAVAPRIIDVFKLNFDNVKSEERKKEIQKIYGEMEYKGLRYLESLIFGSQEQKAPFGLSVRYNTRDVIEIGEIQGSKFSVKSKEFEKSFLYALYGTYATTKERKERFVVRCLKSHANFELIFRVKNEDLWEVILSLLKLISVLGGFGAKTTKGFGQFKIVRIEGENTFNFDRSKYTTKGEIQSLLKETEDILRKYIKKFDTDELLRLEKSSNIDFPNLLDESFEFFESTVTGREDWKKVMEELYKISQDAQRNGVYKKNQVKVEILQAI
ncbi:MAG: type III-B CRISPR module RAMP protein Cmr1 [Pseudothermotoga sp.]|nr:type III-B CRISPR module RAMP protein Cmr1 [Pseudothermotoga sp.]